MFLQQIKGYVYDVWYLIRYALHVSISCKKICEKFWFLISMQKYFDNEKMRVKVGALINNVIFFY